MEFFENLCAYLILPLIIIPYLIRAIRIKIVFNLVDRYSKMKFN